MSPINQKTAVFLPFTIVAIVSLYFIQSLSAAITFYQLELEVEQLQGSWDGAAIGNTYTALISFDPDERHPFLTNWSTSQSFTLSIENTDFDQSTYLAIFGERNIRDYFISARTSNDPNSPSLFPQNDPSGFREIIIRANLENSDDETLKDDSLPGITIGGRGQGDNTWLAQMENDARLSGTFTINLVPEPSAISLIALASAAMLGKRSRTPRNKKKTPNSNKDIV